PAAPASQATHKSSPGSAAPRRRSPAQCAAQCRTHAEDPSPPASAGPSDPVFPAKDPVWNRPCSLLWQSHTKPFYVACPQETARTNGGGPLLKDENIRAPNQGCFQPSGPTESD